jgi:predicted nucleic acid-binding protein
MLIILCSRSCSEIVFCTCHQCAVSENGQDVVECTRYTETGINLVDDYCELDDLWKEAQGEGIKNDHSVCDMYYAVLARRNDAVLITNDRDLASLCRNLKILVCI